MFETTFFNMLNLQSATVGQLRFSPARVHIDGEASLTELSRYLHGSQEERGRSVFGVVLQAMKEKSEGSESRVPIRPKRQRIALERGDTPKKSPPTAARVYQEIQEKHNYVLGHYFRNLYQVLAYIHASAPVEVDRGNELAPSPKRYSNILRAQLSSDELVALYFNCQGTLVDDGTFRGYLIEYEMLEHMPLEYDKERNALLVKAYAFTADILEYAVVSPSGSIRSAFGKNPDVLEFLEVNPGVVTQTQMPGRWDRLKRQEA
ncbi:hypothetical protein HBDW_45760 [Herbaspirillum sp. DW155]|uniref:putative phage abortive infection protein n=1 Tax=Herbaspirillum sp. DW155 TaxID=3095609 RepID=UPI003085590C|nr:hypothetical protein HBDW_45760 [Herbaspirillum sp. DW155]